MLKPVQRRLHVFAGVLQRVHRRLALRIRENVVLIVATLLAVRLGFRIPKATYCATSFSGFVMACNIRNPTMPDTSEPSTMPVFAR